MYEIYNRFASDRKYPSYYTTQKLYNRSLNKRRNLQFRIYDNLEHPHFELIANGDKSIIYDNTNIVLGEFQLLDPPDEQLWPIMIIISEILKKKYHCLTYVVLSETFKEIEKYLDEEGIEYERLGEYGRFNDGRPESTEAYLSQRAKYERERKKSYGL